MIFAPERMVRMELVTLSDEAAGLTGLLASEGSVHIVERALPPRAAGSEMAGAVVVSHREELARLRSLTDELLRLLELRPLAAEPGRREALCAERVEDVLTESGATLRAVREAVDAHLRRRREAEASLTRLDEITEQMHLLHEHDLSFESLRTFAHFHVACGTIERAHASRLADRLEGEPCALAMRPVHGRTAAFLVIGELAEKERLDGILSDAGARTFVPPDRYTASFEEGLEQAEIDLWQQRDRLAELAREFGAARAAWHTTLSECHARLRVRALLDDAMSRLGTDGTVTLISGFVPASARLRLTQRLETEAAGRYYATFERVEHASDARTPTRLHNWRLFRPFELFVRTYGLPGYNDVDPTPFVALSFLAMFGMMFGDVGHGLVLAGIGAAVAFLPYRVFAGMRDLGRILLMAGLSGTLFGFLFGSVFGVEEDAVLPALWMRPSHPEHLTAFLGAALVLGIGILSLGILLSIAQALRRRNVRKALFGQWSAASLVFFWALLVLCGLRMAGRELHAPPGVVAPLLAAPLCLIVLGQILPLFFGHKRSHAADLDSGPAADIGAGAEEGEEEVAAILFEPIEVLMNLFTNSVSFLRVAAFGLAHAALTMSVFTINEMVRIPGASVLSLPFEHLFIIVLEGMIVTIQCLRLEYYEFFSKFFVGNGVAYAPLSLRVNDSIE